MSEVHSFQAVTPPARYDAAPWTIVRVEEAATEGGSFTQIDQQAIAVDLSPETPNPVNLTVVTATLEDGWYRFRFEDAAGNLSPHSAPVHAPGTSGPYATTLAQLNAVLARGDGTYTDDLKTQAMDIATTAFEQAAGVAFVTRTRVLTLDGSGHTDLRLPNVRLQSVSSVTVDGITVNPATVKVDPKGFLYRVSGWPPGRLNVDVTYVHGHATTPADVSHAVAVLASSLLVDGPYDDRGYGITDEGGSIRLLTAGVSGAMFSIPEVQATLARYTMPLVG